MAYITPFVDWLINITFVFFNGACLILLPCILLHEDASWVFHEDFLPATRKLAQKAHMKWRSILYPSIRKGKERCSDPSLLRPYESWDYWSRVSAPASGSASVSVSRDPSPSRAGEGTEELKERVEEEIQTQPREYV